MAGVNDTTALAAAADSIKYGHWTSWQCRQGVTWNTAGSWKPRSSASSRLSLARSVAPSCRCSLAALCSQAADSHKVQAARFSMSLDPPRSITLFGVCLGLVWQPSQPDSRHTCTAECTVCNCHPEVLWCYHARVSWAALCKQAAGVHEPRGAHREVVP